MHGWMKDLMLCIFTLASLKKLEARPIWTLINIYSFLKKIIKLYSPKSSSTESNTIALNKPNPVVSLLDSIDRRHTMKKYFRMLMQGAIVITDRYPSVSMDGPRIDGKSSFLRYLSKLEVNNYLNIPQPDLVIKAEAPLEVTLKRNSERDKPEPEEFVRMRYKLARQIDFKFSQMVSVDTTQNYKKTLSKVRNIIWHRSIEET